MTRKKLNPKVLVERGQFGISGSAQQYLEKKRGIELSPDISFAENIGFLSGEKNPIRQDAIVYKLENAEGRLGGLDLRSIKGEKRHYRAGNALMKAMFCSFNLREALLRAEALGKALLVEGNADALSIYAALGPEAVVIPMLSMKPSGKAMRVLTRFIKHALVMGDRTVEEGTYDSIKRKLTTTIFDWGDVKDQEVKDPNDVINKLGPRKLEAYLMRQRMICHMK